MVNIPFPEGYTGIDDLPKRREMLINLMNINGSLVRTPGIATIGVSGGTGCRGAANWYYDGRAYYVIGTTLFRLESNLTFSNLGTIAGTEDVLIIGEQTELLILVKGGNSYTFSTGDVLTQITNPNFSSSVSAAFIDGITVYIPADGSPAFYSDVDDAATIQAGSFFDAEQLPDINKYVINYKNNIIVFGSESGEIFRTTGNETAPFQRAGNTRFEVGYVSAMSKYQDTYVFIGRQQDLGYAIYAIIGEGRVQKISNQAINEDLEDLTKAQIEAARANRFEWYGIDCVAFTIADRTYMYYDGKWTFLDSTLNGDETGAWRVNGICFSYGEYYVADTSSSSVGILSDIPSEYDQPIEAQIDTFARSSRGSFAEFGYLEVDCLTGQNGTSIGLSLSHDGRTKSDYLYESLGASGDYSKRVKWEPPGGLGYIENYLGISLRVTGEVKFSADSLTIE